MQSLLIPIILLVIGLVLLSLELFVPSGGAIGFLAAAVLIASIIAAFMVNPRTGITFTLVACVVVPLLLWGMFQVWPHTPIGKRLFSRLPTEEEVLPDGDHYQEIRNLVGKHGIAKTKMLPSGSIKIDGRVYDAVSNGMPIEEGDSIEVIAIKTNRIVIRAIRPKSAALPSNPNDILSQSPESLGLDQLEIDEFSIEQSDENDSKEDS